METLKILKEQVLQQAKSEAKRLKDENRQNLMIWKQQAEAEAQEAYVLATEELKKEQQKQKQEFQAHLKMRYRNAILDEKQKYIHQTKTLFAEALSNLGEAKKLELYQKFWLNLCQKHRELQSVSSLEISLNAKDEHLLKELENRFQCKLILIESDKVFLGGFLLFNQDLRYDATFESYIKEDHSQLTVLIHQRLFLDQKGVKS